MTALPLDRIRTDGGTQPRAAISEEVVADYRDAMQGGTTLPPIIVFHDGSSYWLADGFHRYHAAVAIGAKDLVADIRQGTQRDAVLFSVGANASHGLRRTNADKRRAVERLLTDEEWRTWSDRKIAEACGVTHPFVGRLRAILGWEGGNGYHPESEADRILLKLHLLERVTAIMPAAQAEAGELLAATDTPGEVIDRLRREASQAGEYAADIRCQHAGNLLSPNCKFAEEQRTIRDLSGRLQEAFGGIVRATEARGAA